MPLLSACPHLKAVICICRNDGEDRLVHMHLCAVGRDRHGMPHTVCRQTQL